MTAKFIYFNMFIEMYHLATENIQIVPRLKIVVNIQLCFSCQENYVQTFLFRVPVITSNNGEL
jgi:hypothetical protein